MHVPFPVLFSQTATCAESDDIDSFPAIAIPNCCPLIRPGWPSIWGGEAISPASASGKDQAEFLDQAWEGPGTYMGGPGRLAEVSLEALTLLITPVGLLKVTQRFGAQSQTKCHCLAN